MNLSAENPASPSLRASHCHLWFLHTMPAAFKLVNLSHYPQFLTQACICFLLGPDRFMLGLCTRERTRSSGYVHALLWGFSLAWVLCLDFKMDCSQTKTFLSYHHKIFLISNSTLIWRYHTIHKSHWNFTKHHIHVFFPSWVRIQSRAHMAFSGEVP